MMPLMLRSLRSRPIGRHVGAIRRDVGYRSPHMGESGGGVRRAAREIVGALPEPAQRRIRSWRGLPSVGPSMSVDLDDLDDALDHAAKLFASSEDEAREFLLDIELRVPDDRPADPFSSGYRAWTWDLYERISRRQYGVCNEHAPF